MISRRRHPAPGALTRARALLLTLAAEGDASTLIEGVGRLERWEALARICDSAWLPITRRPSAAALRVARRRLRLLGSQPAAFAVVADLAGEPVHLRGVCARLPGSAARDELWRSQVADEADGRWLVEEAHDFLLTAPDGSVVQVVAEEGRLLGDVLRAGDEASVFGLVAHVPDAAGRAPSGRGRGGLMPALRGDAELPLLVCPFRRYAEDVGL